MKQPSSKVEAPGLGGSRKVLPCGLTLQQGQDVWEACRKSAARLSAQQHLKARVWVRVLRSREAAAS